MAASDVANGVVDSQNATVAGPAADAAAVAAAVAAAAAAAAGGGAAVVVVEDYRNAVFCKRKCH